MSLATLRTRLLPLLGLVLFCLALWLLGDALTGVRYGDVLAHLAGLPREAVVAAAALTVLSYLVLTGYDVLALRYIDRPLPYRRTAVASFVAYAVGHTLGQSWLTGGTVRYRLYAAWGLSAANVAAVVAFGAFTFWLGFLATGGVVFLAAPPVVPAEVRLPGWLLPALGATGLGATAAYLGLGALRRRPVRLLGLALAVPPWRQRVAQVAVSVGDWLLAAATLFVLLPPGIALGYETFVGVYLFAVVAGIASQVPGGLGVFEGVIVLALAPAAPASAVLGSLVAFRAVYHLAPLAAAAVLLVAYEAARAASGLAAARRLLARSMPHVAPHLLTVTTFFAGALLLLSCAVPAAPDRLDRLGALLPLGLIEGAHLVASLVGAGLLLAARGLQLRLAAAHRLTARLLAAGIAAALLKGLDHETAAVLALVLAALLPSRRYFPRRAPLAGEAMSPGWLGAIGVVLAGAVAVGLFAYAHADAPGLWRQLFLHGEASRFLRASVAVGLLLAGLLLWRLRQPEPPEPGPATPEALARAEAVVAAAPRTAGWLALLGDTSLLFSGSGRAFLMYGIEGKSWVALGDPVGPDAEAPELVWRFREMCDRHGGWPVFHEVGPHHLPLYLDLGLILLKVGEEARVPLAGRGRDDAVGPEPAAALARLAAKGVRVEVLRPGAASPLSAELRAVSDEWLRATGARERRFSIARFDERYVSRGAVAVAWAAGRVVAFATVRLGAPGGDVSPDLVRHREDAPDGIATGLRAEVLRWGRAQGYRWASLGMAPLAGAPDPALTPLWERIGPRLVRASRGELAPFRPEWEARYLAAPTGLALPHVLADLAALVTGHRVPIGR